MASGQTPMEISLSSAKRGYSLRELMSPVEGEFWNTDDSLPHSIHISFPARTYVYALNIFLSYALDESYTPENILLCFDDRRKEFALTEPEGMVELLVDASVYDIYVVIASNHSDGKDTHVRMLKVMVGPHEEIKCGCRGIDG